MSKYTWQQWLQGLSIYLGKKLCKAGLHSWDYTVVDGMSFRCCKRCGIFKNEGDE